MLSVNRIAAKKYLACVSHFSPPEINPVKHEYWLAYGCRASSAVCSQGRTMDQLNYCLVIGLSKALLAAVSL